MQKLNIVEFFDKTKFNYKVIEEKLFEINRITKTRVDSTKKHITEHCGIEQSFLLYYIAYILKTNTFFEIGTGRGTASYSIALLDSINNIFTFDIIPFKHKMKGAINFIETYASNEDLFNLIPYDEKNKINFKNISELDDSFKNKYKSTLDLAFIDGCHDNYNTIMDDFTNANFLTKDDGVIVFDDYGSFPVVTKVIDDVIKKFPEYGYILITFRGHLFMKDNISNKSGEVILFKNKSKMSLFGL